MLDDPLQQRYLLRPMCITRNRCGSFTIYHRIFLAQAECNLSHETTNRFTLITCTIVPGGQLLPGSIEIAARIAGCCDRGVIFVFLLLLLVAGVDEEWIVSIIGLNSIFVMRVYIP